MPLSPPSRSPDGRAAGGERYAIAALVQLLSDLRDPVEGCPWDRDQTFASIAPYTIEEAYEVADAIAREDIGALKDELGDLLLQTVYHARIAEEAGAFDFGDVVDGIVSKMIRRHPHVYGDAGARDAGAQTQAWEALKAEERAGEGAAGALAGVALGHPALLRAQKLQKRAARVGFDWPDASGPRAKIDEELAECAAALGDEAALEHEIGDLLFSVVNWARHLGVDAEAALRGANHRFERRFAHVEMEAGAPLDTLDIAALEGLWGAAKAAERAG